MAKKNDSESIINDPDFEIAISVGFAAYDPDIDRTYSDVFQRADNAMYVDKRDFYMTHEDRRKRRN